jgi:hypothetical protein
MKFSHLTWDMKPVLPSSDARWHFLPSFDLKDLIAGLTRAQNQQWGESTALTFRGR